MYRKRTTLFYFLILATGLSVLFFPSCRNRSVDGMIVLTEAKKGNRQPNYVSGEAWRYLSEARIIAINPEDPGKSELVLTEDFYSACYPHISYDGKSMLFAAQQKQNDPWQIWEMKLKNSKIRQITTSRENSTDPAYLPTGAIIFSRSTANDSLKAGHTLFSCKADGTGERRITFNPHAYFASSVLKDGRVITISRKVYPESGPPSIMVLRPDGTKSELFYKGAEGTELFSRGWETENGRVVFIESDSKDKTKGNIISINYNRPLHSATDLSAGISGDFHSAFPLHSGHLLVSFRASESDRYAVYDFDPEQKVLDKPLFISPDFDIIDAVVTAEHARPKKLPSEVDMGVKTGLLLCQDADFTDIKDRSSDISVPKADRIEVIGVDSSLGVINVENDGSFYLKITADKPFRIKTMDKEGHVLQGPGSWIWLRPNERRGCAGCHEDQEMVPRNRISLAVKKQPVTVPVHVSRIKEKAVDLE